MHFLHTLFVPGGLLHPNLKLTKFEVFLIKCLYIRGHGYGPLTITPTS